MYNNYHQFYIQNYCTVQWHLVLTFCTVLEYYGNANHLLTISANKKITGEAWKTMGNVGTR